MCAFSNISLHKKSMLLFELQHNQECEADYSPDMQKSMLLPIPLNNII